MPHQFWKALEWLPGLSALPAGWKENLGEKFEPFKKLCLTPKQTFPQYTPCPRHCGCDHSIILRHDRTAAIGACCCNPPRCPDIPLTIEEITPWKLDWDRLGFALAHALGCTPRILAYEPHTRQIGAWSTTAVPVILTIQFSRCAFQATIARLATAIQKPFILLSPTSLNLDPVSLDLLSHAHATFLDLQSTVDLHPDATLHAVTPPHQLFARMVNSNPLPNPTTAPPIPTNDPAATSASIPARSPLPSDGRGLRGQG